ncbi:two-component sensor histidine kinase [Sporanaerobium hydrogeniformans]|uniref:Two-component sensor histidine kinase n=1 Tax=Sporanaerobium hydrogeniformans TaxID=3072179 RepID=A0AC61D9E2_9FIRM|nr:histidine kinase [Sporanaerobium hydrogeniformans]PHV69410.1 two-component sensor histidine kinase [Sporanaerobium hydrogeniformans]
MNRAISLIKSKWYSLKIRTKLITVFMFTFLIVLIINFFMYSNINAITRKIDKVYMSNVNLNQLIESLAAVQNSMTDYLNTKNSAALQEYYAWEQNYSKQMGNLNNEITDDDRLLMEKNIKSMSENYLRITNETMQAKRSRNVEKYKKYYEEASELFTHINTYIYSLNNGQFKYNSHNYQVLLSSLQYLETIVTIIIIVVIIASIVLIYFLTYSITNPLTELAEAANEIAKGHFDVSLIKNYALDEVGIVSRAFNHMIISIQEYIQRIKMNLEIENAMKEKELIIASHLKDAQLKYLQAQINPHFLFNTLNAGAQLAMMEGADTTCVFIENMADFFRYNIKKINEDATLEEELKLVDNYIHILNVRFVGEINYKKEVEDTLIKVRVPSMILQPIVENAVNYGIRDIEWEGRIELKVYEEDSFINISISDNGVGISESKIQEILQGKGGGSEKAKNSNGIGLDNVITRLRLYYGIEDVFEIISEGHNKGTQVIIHIPKVNKAVAC